MRRERQFCVIIEMQKQTCADSIDEELSWCLAVLRGYSDQIKTSADEEKPDEETPPS